MKKETKQPQAQTNSIFKDKVPLNEQAAAILGINSPKHSTYAAIINRYEKLAIENEWKNGNKTIWPISRENLTRFITYLYPRVTPSTITSYLCALKYHHNMYHMEWNCIRYDPLIKQLLKTIEDNHTFKPTQQKEHITRDQLRDIKGKLCLENPDDLVFWSVALVAFYGLARLGELLPKSHQDIMKVPTIQALKFEKAHTGTFAIIQLPRTKNHKVTERPTLIINPTNDDLCPIHVLKKYAILRTNSIHASGSKILFTRANGNMATKGWFINILKSLLPNANVAGHSFRAGGTTELVIRGVHLPLVQRIGRWSSDAFLKYIRTHPATIAAILTKAYSD